MVSLLKVVPDAFYMQQAAQYLAPLEEMGVFWQFLCLSQDQLNAFIVHIRWLSLICPGRWGQVVVLLARMPPLTKLRGVPQGLAARFSFSKGGEDQQQCLTPEAMGGSGATPCASTTWGSCFTCLQSGLPLVFLAPFPVVPYNLYSCRFIFWLVCQCFLSSGYFVLISLLEDALASCDFTIPLPPSAPFRSAVTKACSIA